MKRLSLCRTDIPSSNKQRRVLFLTFTRATSSSTNRNNISDIDNYKFLLHRNIQNVNFSPIKV